MYIARSETIREIKAIKTRQANGQEFFIKRKCQKPWPAVAAAMDAFGKETTFVLWYLDENGSNRKAWTLNAHIVRRVMSAILRWAPDQHKRSTWFDLRSDVNNLHRLLTAEVVSREELLALHHQYRDVPMNGTATQVERDMAAMVGYATKVIDPHMQADQLIADSFSPYLGSYPVPMLNAFIECAARIAAFPVSSNTKNRLRQVKGVANDELMRVMRQKAPGRKLRVPVSQQQLELPGMAVTSP
jgi:hypothetical protein